MMEFKVVQVRDEESRRLYGKAKEWGKRKTIEFYVVEEIDTTAVVTEEALDAWLKTLDKEELNYYSIHLFELNTFYDGNCIPEPIDHKSRWKEIHS